MIHILTDTKEEFNMVNDIISELQEKMALNKLVMKEVKVHEMGVGPINTAKYLYEHKDEINKEDKILNIGLAGFKGEPQSRIYNVVHSVNLDEDMRPLGEENFATHLRVMPLVHVNIPITQCYSSASFVTKELAEYRGMEDYALADMELHTIVGVLPNFVYSIKFVSDTLDGGQYNDDLGQCISKFKELLLPVFITIIQQLQVN